MDPPGQPVQSDASPSPGVGAQALCLGPRPSNALHVLRRFARGGLDRALADANAERGQLAAALATDCASAFHGAVHVRRLLSGCRSSVIASARAGDSDVCVSRHAE